MALTPGDKAECKQIAREIVKEVLVEHVDMCPHGKNLMAAKYIAAGACLGSGLAGGGIGVGLMKMLA